MSVGAEVELILNDAITPRILRTSLGEMVERLHKEEGMALDHPSTWRIAARRITAEHRRQLAARERAHQRAHETEEAGQLQLGQVAEQTRRRHIDPETQEIPY